MGKTIGTGVVTGFTVLTARDELKNKQKKPIARSVKEKIIKTHEDIQKNKRKTQAQTGWFTYFKSLLK